MLKGVIFLLDEIILSFTVLLKFQSKVEKGKFHSLSNYKDPIVLQHARLDRSVQYSKRGWKTNYISLGHHYGAESVILINCS